MKRSAVYQRRIQKAASRKRYQQAQATAKLAIVGNVTKVSEPVSTDSDSVEYVGPKPVENRGLDNTFNPATITRNQKCPCGSGKKIKVCHPELMKTMSNLQASQMFFTTLYHDYIKAAKECLRTGTFRPNVPLAPQWITNPVPDDMVHEALCAADRQEIMKELLEALNKHSSYNMHRTMGGTEQGRNDWLLEDSRLRHNLSCLGLLRILSKVEFHAWIVDRQEVEKEKANGKGLVDLAVEWRKDFPKEAMHNRQHRRAGTEPVQEKRDHKDSLIEFMKRSVLESNPPAFKLLEIKDSTLETQAPIKPSFE